MKDNRGHDVTWASNQLLDGIITTYLFVVEEIMNWEKECKGSKLYSETGCFQIGKFGDEFCVLPHSSRIVQEVISLPLQLTISTKHKEKWKKDKLRWFGLVSPRNSPMWQEETQETTYCYWARPEKTWEFLEGNREGQINTSSNFLSVWCAWRLSRTSLSGSQVESASNWKKS